MNAGSDRDQAAAAAAAVAGLKWEEQRRRRREKKKEKRQRWEMINGQKMKEGVWSQKVQIMKNLLQEIGPTYTNVSLIIMWLTLAFCSSTSPPRLPPSPSSSPSSSTALTPPHLFTACICAAASSSIMDEEVKHNTKKEPNAGISAVEEASGHRAGSWRREEGWGVNCFC